MRGYCEHIRGYTALALAEMHEAHTLTSSDAADVFSMLHLGYRFKEFAGKLFFDSTITAAIANLIKYLRRYNKDAVSGVRLDDVIEFSRRHLRAGNLTDDGHAVLALFSAMPSGADGVPTLRMICHMIERGANA